MTLHPVIAGARRLDGGRRFYPLGEHPATARYRAQRAKLLELPPSKERNEALEYVNSALAAFEEGESFAKAVYLQCHRGHV